MRKAVLWIYLVAVLGGCKASSIEVPLPKEHPAYGFYQTASAFYVSSKSCVKLNGSLQIRPDKVGDNGEYEKVAELMPGLLRIREKATGKEWITVYFMEYGLAASIPKTCSWETEKYPVGSFSKASGAQEIKN